MEFLLCPQAQANPGETNTFRDSSCEKCWPENMTWGGRAAQIVWDE